MDDKKIQSILQDALEEEIPSSEIKLWPAVKASLIAGRTFQQGENMNSIPSRRISPVALIVLVVGTLMAVAFITPQGRAFAQSVLQFFTRAESDTFPLQPSQIVTDPGDTSAPTAEPPSALISVTEAEAQVGFDAAELPLIPDGFDYLGARVYGNAISIEYEALGGGGNLMIMQSEEGFLQSDWDQVPAEAITPVKVNGADAEFAQGTFVVFPDATSATWNADAPVLRLRWIKDGIWFEMTKFGDVESIEYLDRDGLIELAERLTTGLFPWNLENAEAQAGFDVLEPGVLPQGMMFLGSSLDPFSKTTFLSFGYSETERSILIQQQPVSSPETCDLCTLIGASAEVETIQVRGTAGEYVIGVWKADDLGNWIWEYEPFLQRLRWQENGMAFEILYMGPPEQITKDDLVAIAESMK
jgi:hypothetical protein